MLTRLDVVGISTDDATVAPVELGPTLVGVVAPDARRCDRPQAVAGTDGHETVIVRTALARRMMSHRGGFFLLPPLGLEIATVSIYACPRE